MAKLCKTRVLLIHCPPPKRCQGYAYIPEGLKKVGSSDWDHDVNVVDDEKWFIQHLVWEVSQVVRDEQKLTEIRPLLQTQNPISIVINNTKQEKAV